MRKTTTKIVRVMETTCPFCNQIGYFSLTRACRIKEDIEVIRWNYSTCTICEKDSIIVPIPDSENFELIGREVK